MMHSLFLSNGFLIAQQFELMRVKIMRAKNDLIQNVAINFDEMKNAQILIGILTRFSRSKIIQRNFKTSIHQSIHEDLKLILKSKYFNTYRNQYKSHKSSF